MDNNYDYYQTEYDDIEVFAAEPVPKKTRQARKEVFDGVHIPPHRNKENERPPSKVTTNLPAPQVAKKPGPRKCLTLNHLLPQQVKPTDLADQLTGLIKYKNQPAPAPPTHTLLTPQGFPINRPNLTTKSGRPLPSREDEVEFYEYTVGIIISETEGQVQEEADKLEPLIKRCGYDQIKYDPKKLQALPNFLALEDDETAYVHLIHPQSGIGYTIYCILNRLHMLDEPRPSPLDTGLDNPQETAPERDPAVIEAGNSLSVETESTGLVEELGLPGLIDIETRADGMIKTESWHRGMRPDFWGNSSNLSPHTGNSCDIVFGGNSPGGYSYFHVIANLTG
ncbi:hypothetical protein FPV67DRAFT_1448060 [Lyophyllum atratum]|nr:hypothetical protein FPV67DRAFT_1448060 [Lyophyllum atratum]